MTRGVESFYMGSRSGFDFYYVGLVNYITVLKQKEYALRAFRDHPDLDVGRLNDGQPYSTVFCF